MRRTITCTKCGQTRPHAAHGLCKRCYDQEYIPQSMHECRHCHSMTNHTRDKMCNACYQYQYRNHRPRPLHNNDIDITAPNLRDYINQCRKGTIACDEP